MEGIEPVDYSGSLLKGSLYAIAIITLLLLLFLRRSFFSEIGHFFGNFFGFFGRIFG